jgi:hypothetical protein
VPVDLPRPGGLEMRRKVRIAPEESVALPRASRLRRLCSGSFRAVYQTRQIMFNLGIFLITRLLPRRMWFPAIWRICRLQAFLAGPIIARSILRNDPRRKVIVAWTLEAWLRRLKRLQPEYVPPIEARGLETVPLASGNQNGLVFCSVHLPLVDATLAPISRIGCAPAAVVAANMSPGERYPIWGYEEGLPAINSDGLALVKMRSILRRGGSVAVLVDTDWCTTFSANTFRLVRSLGTRLIFMLPEIQPNGQIVVEYSQPPDPLCSSDESIRLNMRALQVGIDRILSGHRKSQGMPVVPLRTITSEAKSGVPLEEIDTAS